MQQRCVLSLLVVITTAVTGTAPQNIKDIDPPTETFQCGRIETRSNSGCQTEWDPSSETCLKLCHLTAGEDAVKNYWPWMAVIGGNHSGEISWNCGGVLINQQWILTTVDCTKQTVAVVRLGEYNLDDECDEPPPEDFTVLETLIYPDFNGLHAYHNLALMKLNSSVTLKSHISPVCLPWGTESDKDITGQQATVTGWGATQFGGDRSSTLKQISVTVFPPDQCQRGYTKLPTFSSKFPQGIGNETLCAGDPAGGPDACQGDSGGPLVSPDSLGRYMLGGIVSTGHGCGLKDFPGLYVNVRLPPYLGWIKKVAFGTQ